MGRNETRKPFQIPSQLTPKDDLKHPCLHRASKHCSDGCSNMANTLRRCALSTGNNYWKMLNVITLTCTILTEHHPTSDLWLKTSDISNRVLVVTAKKCIKICCFVKILFYYSYFIAFFYFHAPIAIVGDYALHFS